jgi:hypothetical protein
MQSKQVPACIARLLLCAVLACWFASEGRTQSAVYPPPSPGASSCGASFQ